MDLSEIKVQAREVVNNPNLDYSQRHHQLAILAENLLDYPELTEGTSTALDKRIVCDMYEGSAPYRPRYILPDYQKALKQGCKYLELEAPADLDEALNFLTILYNHVPSITGYPVYLGNIDQLVTPYLGDLTDQEIKKKLKLFWRSIDRMLPDAFVHANIGPHDSRAGRIILELEREVKQVVPNLTLKYDPEITPDELLLEAVKTCNEVAKPHIAYHPDMVSDLGEDYAVVSCYNSLKVGGGAHTLARLNLKETAKLHTGTIDEYLKATLPEFVEKTLELIEARSKYLVEEQKFFEHSFLAKEGLIDLSLFTSMFGIIGMAEAVDLLLESAGKTGNYGHDQEANDLALQITEKISDLLLETTISYCEGSDDHAMLHAQSGIGCDIDVTAGARVPIGTEPGLFEHIQAVAPLHKNFKAGISDIFKFDETVKNNPESVLDIIKGSFEQGMRHFTFYLENGDFVRVTGYLVRKSDVEKFDKEGARHGSTAFGAESFENHGIEERNIRVLNNEFNAGMKS